MYYVLPNCSSSRGTEYKLYLILLNSYQVPLFGWWLIKLLEDRVRSVPIPVNGASMEKPGAGRLIRCVRRPGAWPTSSRQITVLCNLLFNCLINHSSDESSHYSITVLYIIIRYYSIIRYFMHTILCFTVMCSTVLCVTVLCSTVFHAYSIYGIYGIYGI